MKNIHAIRCDMFDIVHYEDLRNQSRKLNELMSRAEQSGLHTYVPLLQDVYDALYQHSPAVVDVNEDYAANRMVMEELLKTSEYQELHHSTRLNVFGSAIGTVTLGASAMSILQEMRQELEQALKQQQEAQKKAENDPGDARAQEAQDQAQQHLDALRSQLRSKVRSAAQKAQEDIDDAEAATGLGRGFSDVDPSEISLTKQFEFAELAAKDSLLRDIVERLGKVEIISQQAQKAKMEYVSGETTDIEVGRDLARLLPSELVKLTSPTLKKDWQRRYVEGTLLQYRLVQRKPVGRGPIVVCVDESGSMMGNRLLWAKAVAIAMAKLAVKQHRAFAFIPFSFSTEVYEHPKGLALKDIVNIAKHNYGSGTDFERPLRKAVGLLEKAEFSKGDLVFVTDGDASISSSFFDWFREVKKEKGFRAVGLLIGDDTWRGYFVSQLWDETERVKFAHSGLDSDEQKALSVVFST